MWPSAVYEWNYARQMIEIRLAEATGEESRERLADDVFDRKFLVERPLLQALSPHDEGPPVLLIDELDRADEPFDAFLLEILADYQVSIPEIGTIKAEVPPVVVITSNRTREIHDALKRRCFYYWIDYPSAERELEIVQMKVPDARQALSREIVEFVQRLRGEDLFKAPGIAETLDWTRALGQLGILGLEPSVVSETLGVILKYQDDIGKVQSAPVVRILEQVRAKLERAAG